MEYMTTHNLDEALTVLGEWKGRAKLVAGGTNLIPNMRAKLVSPDVIINLCEVEGLKEIREEDGIVRIGALATMSEIGSSEIIGDCCPILASAARQLGNPLTRNRATVGGNLADASPAADTAPPLLALDAVVHATKAGSREREIPLDQFFLGPRETVLEPDEIITHFTLAKPKDPSRGSHIKLGLRNAMAISVVSMAAMLDVDGDRCTKARVALGAVAPRPIRAYGVERMLERKRIDERLLDECSELIKEEISPISDIRASAQYRTLVTSVLFRRCIQKSLEGGSHEDL
ncbi:MAG: xanthine dehydrogenase family protein subunit M [Deltaproteobacteria bacterium]|nr:xanthine dehydrogenase family protein subunit M [Deltaproteobacteria bacterium]